jgi:uncharacterized protein
MNRQENAMQCPVCDERMKEVERFGVSIDICPGCKGVWLDRGELDKILSMSRLNPGSEATPGPDRAVPRPGFLEEGYASLGQSRHDHDYDRRHRQDRGHDRDRGGRDEGDHEHAYGRRRGSWLGDLFGGDD